jgi:Spy/CpxP family protein refolding chaperone
MKRSLVFVLLFLLGGSLLASTAYFVAAQRRNVALEQAMRADMLRAEAVAARASLEGAAACCSTSVIECCVSELPLTAEQKQTLLAACADRCDDLPALAKATEDARTGLDAALAESPVDRAKVDAALSALCDARAKELRARVEAILVVRDVLAPEQIEKLRDLLGPR